MTSWTWMRVATDQWLPVSADCPSVDDSFETNQLSGVRIRTLFREKCPNPDLPRNGNLTRTKPYIFNQLSWSRFGCGRRPDTSACYPVGDIWPLTAWRSRPRCEPNSAVRKENCHIYAGGGSFGDIGKSALDPRGL